MATVTTHPPPLAAAADAMLGVLMRRADVPAGARRGRDEEAELKATVDASEAYEAKPWPDGRDRAAKGNC
jgi:hypothetical protein